MDKERIKGTAQHAKGAVKEAVGKVTGDNKMKAEGKVDQAVGKARDAVGRAKDTVRDLSSRH